MRPLITGGQGETEITGEWFMKALIYSLAASAMLAGSILSLSAEVPVAVVPLTGDKHQAQQLETKIKQKIIELGGVSVVGDNDMRKVLEMHEKAMALGSQNHDVSRLMIAEYLVKGSVESGKAQVSVVAVNTNLEIFNKSFDYPGASAYTVNKELSSLRDAVVLDAYSKERDLPSDCGPYMRTMRQFISSLETGAESSYPFIAFYSAGKYSHPDAKNPALVRQAKLFLDVVRPKLVRAKLIFAGMRQKAPFVEMYIFADKVGAKSKHRLDFMDLPDGSLGIVQYQPE